MRRVVTSTPAPRDGLLPTALARADHADAYSTPLLPGDPTSPDGWASLSIDRVPGWIALAMRVRNRLARRLGLKTPARGTERRPPFPELGRSDHEILYGIDDRHLDFRVVLRVQDGSFVFATSVQVNNALGRAYWTVVRLVHPLVVKSLLRSVPQSARPAS